MKQSVDATIFHQSLFWLLLGDILVLMLFVVIGGMEHRLGLDAKETIVTSFPYVIAWITVGATTGAYRPRAYSHPANAAIITAITWVIAHPLALVIRMLLYDKPVFTPFAIIAFFFIYGFLVIWRILFTIVHRKLR